MLDVVHRSWENALTNGSVATWMFFISFIGCRLRTSLHHSTTCSQYWLSGKVSLDRLISCIALLVLGRCAVRPSRRIFITLGLVWACCIGPMLVCRAAVEVRTPATNNDYISATRNSPNVSKQSFKNDISLIRLALNLLLTVRDCRQLLNGCKHLCTT